MDRNQAWDIVCEFVQSASLRKHMLAVEACVAAYARQFGEDEQKWPSPRCCTTSIGRFTRTRRIIPSRANAFSPSGAWRRRSAGRILSHADYTGVPRISRIEKTLFACDELEGFLTACSYVKPGRSIHEVDVKGVRKKLKDKAFARNVSRDDIFQGAAEIGIDLDEHIDVCIRAMQAKAAELGLAGAWSQLGTAAT
jgi:predicted hydrolase (HD superfamily)